MKIDPQEKWSHLHAACSAFCENMFDFALFLDSKWEQNKCIVQKSLDSLKTLIAFGFFFMLYIPNNANFHRVKSLCCFKKGHLHGFRFQKGKTTSGDM